jgi:hypothetical protein
MLTKRASLEDEYYRFFREEAQHRRERSRDRHEQARADEVERRLLLAEIAAHDGSAHCPACGSELSLDALMASGNGCPSCAGRSRGTGSSLRETGTQGIRRKLIDYFFL